MIEPATALKSATATLTEDVHCLNGSFVRLSMDETPDRQRRHGVEIVREADRILLEASTAITALQGIVAETNALKQKVGVEVFALQPGRKIGVE